MIDKFIKRCLTPFFIGETPIAIAVSSDFTPAKMANIKSLSITKCQNSEKQ